jgi:predicted DCC family thiol-disulfide oxidoreductase YuxK
MNSELTEKTDIREAFSGQGLAGRPQNLHSCLLPAGKGTSWRQKDVENASSFRGWILYDYACPSCTASARRFAGIFRGRGFLFLPLQTEWVRQQLGRDPGAPLEEMHVLTSQGQDIAGADAIIFLARQIWWAWPLVVFAELPGMHKLLDRGYRWTATHRGCDHVACEVDMRRWDSAGLFGPSTGKAPLLEAGWKPLLLKALPAWMGLIGLPISVLPLRDRLQPWQFMWLMAGAIFFGCKWLTAWRAQKPNADLKLTSTLGYFFAWPGMDAEKFLCPSSARPQLDGFKPSSSTRLNAPLSAALFKILLGALILFGAARFASQPLLAGWIGMIGMILILHFGLFRLLAIAWRKAGIYVEPLMNAPLRSKTVSEFWGRRWNSAFHQLAFEFVSRPIIRRLGRRSSRDTALRFPWGSTLHFGAAIATLTAFFVSGFIHELMISLPAGGDYGLPTAYFLVQGTGILLERIFPQIRGRTFTVLVTAVPAFFLFHPPFVHNVILPFMKSIEAL